jgi:hypothetical protein
MHCSDVSLCRHFDSTAAADSPTDRRLYKERILQVAAVSGHQKAALKFNSATMTAAAAGIHWG